MTKEKENYNELMENFDPASSMEGAEKHYTDEKFWNKIMKFGKKAGKKTVYYSLLLFYAAKSPNVPKSAKLTIVGALGYLILPLDLIPDFIPVVGLADDAAVIMYALYKVISHIDDEIKENAKEKFKQIFGDDVDFDGIDEKFIKASCIINLAT